MMLKAIITGAIGGAIGAALWAFSYSYLGYEFAWIAIGVGALVGLGARVGAGDGLSFKTGLVAGVIAIVSVAGGKYAGVYLDAQRELGGTIFTDENYISFAADQIVEQYKEQGRPVNWPAGSDPNDAWEEVDYPADVWVEALAYWNDMSQREQADYRAYYKPDALAVANEMFPLTFSPWDFLWFGGAVIAAFKMGSEGKKESVE